MLTRIRQEGFRHSQVMATASELDDRIGPRLTASPNMKRANDWTRDQLAQWGLSNAHLEPWGTYDRGWQQEAVSVRMLSPDITNFIAYPKPWTPSTDGVIHGKAIKVKMEKKEDFDQYKGKLAGMIVLFGDMWMNMAVPLVIVPVAFAAASILLTRLLRTTAIWTVGMALGCAALCLLASGSALLLSAFTSFYSGF